jgi:hypothetical protein
MSEGQQYLGAMMVLMPAVIKPYRQDQHLHKRRQEAANERAWL